MANAAFNDHENNSLIDVPNALATEHGKFDQTATHQDFLPKDEFGRNHHSTFALPSQFLSWHPV